MSTPLGLEPLENDKYAILLALFGIKRDQAATLWKEFNEFFTNYSSELRQICFGFTGSSSWMINQLAVNTHQDILYICKFLAENKSLKRPEVREKLRRSSDFTHFGDEAIDRSVDLTVRLWLMVNVRDQALRIYDAQKTPVQWPDSDSLEKFIANQFPKSQNELSRKEARLGTSFTAAYLVDVCGLQLYWTNNLQDHLLLDRRLKILQIFSNQHILAGHRDSKEFGAECVSVLPLSLPNETIKSLNLLFPDWEPYTQRLLMKEERTLARVHPYQEPRRSLTEFSHWRDRLLELHEEVYLAPPSSLRQIWADHRHPENWYLFWIGVVVLILSLISCAASIVQAWASIRSL